MSSQAPELHLLDGGWRSSGATRARGAAHLGERFLDAARLAEALDACASEDDWRRTVAALNGSFAAITMRGGILLAAVDRLRSLPLFHARSGGTRLLADSAGALRKSLGGGRIDELCAEEFRLTGYVTGGCTLDPDIGQIEAGVMLRWTGAAGAPPEFSRYYGFRHGDFFDPDPQRLVGRLEEVHAAVFRRLLRSAEGRGIVVPLSGGYDSRLIGVSLRDLGARDVVCYTYGLAGNWEAGISRELAAYLGFRWEFVPYTAQSWRAWGVQPQFEHYLRSAGNLCAAPHVQDWPAVFELQRGRRVAPDAVFVPGHSGDFLAGSHIPKAFARRSAVPRDELLAALFHAHFSLWEWPRAQRPVLEREFAKRMEASAGPLPDGSSEAAADYYERWDLQERQAKFICNSVRVYESLGYGWRLPLFDNELMDFWARVPIELRVGRRLYFEFVRRRQALPITPANRDRGAAGRWLVASIDALGLGSAARDVRRRIRCLRWRRQREQAELAWFALVDPEFFRRTYTGIEKFHSYMALAYLDWCRGRFESGSAAASIAALARPEGAGPHG